MPLTPLVYATLTTMLICSNRPKSLPRKGLGRFWAARVDVSPYVSTTYDDYVLTITSVHCIRIAILNKKKK